MLNQISVNSGLSLKALSKSIRKTPLTGTAHILVSLLLVACGKQKTDDPNSDNQSPVSSGSQTTTTSLTPNQDYRSDVDISDLISTTYTVFKTISTISDNNHSDGDILNISTSEDVKVTPKISGFEKINFTINEDFSSDDNSFSIDLGTVSDFTEIKVSNSSSNSSIPEIFLFNAKGNILLGTGLSDIKVNTVSNEDISISVEENANIIMYNNAGNTNVVGSGSSIVELVTSNVENIEISDVGSISMIAPKAKGNIKIISNGDVNISDASSLEGNVTISSVGKITLDNLGAVTGKIQVDNLRAPDGSYIVFADVAKAKSIDAKSAGSISAILNGGFKSAEVINITVAEDSTIHAIGSSPKSVKLNAINDQLRETSITIDINSMNDLDLGGTVPIKVIVSGDDLDKTTVSKSTSASASLIISAANTDLSGISNEIQIHLPNFDGKTAIVGQNQNFILDAEVLQTRSTASPKFDFVTNVTSNSDNTISFKVIDTITTNADNSAVFAGLTLDQIQTVNFELAEGVEFQTSQDITGAQLSKVYLTGLGNFTFDNSTIVGGLGNSFVLDAQTLNGKLVAEIDNTQNSLKDLKSGFGDDTIKIDGTRSTGSGISVNTGGGNDTISLTSNSDGDTAILSIDGGDGIDIVTFSSGLNFKLSQLSLDSIEKIEFTGGRDTIFLPSSSISGETINISENGSGDLTLSIFPNSQSIDISALNFDENLVSGQDKISLDGSNFTQALTITSSKIDDEIKGTHTSNDIIVSGDGNDTIYGNGGNDTITPGNGIDHVTPGLGNDTINLTEIVRAVDTVYYSIDAGVGNVDTITFFDLQVANDLLSIDVSELPTAITHGNASAASVARAGTISIIDHARNTNLNISTNSSANIIKLSSIDQSDFASAIGTGIITVANAANIAALWFDKDTSEAVFGYSSEESSGPDDNTIIAADGFVEIVRISMSSTDYTHYLNANSFEFI